MQITFFFLDPLQLELTVSDLEQRVSRLEEQLLPRLVRLEAMLPQQYCTTGLSASLFSQQETTFQPFLPVQQRGGYIQQSSPSLQGHFFHQHTPQPVANASAIITQQGTSTRQSTPQSLDPAQCKPIRHRESTTYLPSTSINKLKLATPEVVVAKYSRLRVESKVGILAVKLAKESFFGEEVLERCTVSGYRDLPALPLEELNNLKQTIFQQFPNYWSTPEEYEGLWERAAEAIGQCAKGLRKKHTT